MNNEKCSMESLGTGGGKVGGREGEASGDLDAVALASATKKGWGGGGFGLGKLLLVLFDCLLGAAAVLSDDIDKADNVKRDRDPLSGPREKRGSRSELSASSMSRVLWEDGGCKIAENG
ncbi:hypothetical protein E4U54_000322 [Claviceps lovelessii]|nr:hypothetical protein E4U54_000322 [Claviceps lovelessii]